ncbi:MAG: nitroreductase family protein [Methanospirillum sp.]|uniref:nitroreductase family protein n=1 Tax=Methanospirillum sp. TaxID=45200 RepID=UPI002371C31E|nr:nitroreductase family protein [Methanospirillum sp.]MDD1727927.1 nitroreductase family protein [Methanospirillum sp.]
MTTILINTESCSGCAICSGVCAYGILDTGSDGKIQVKPGTEDFCGRCGQCEAICPEGAITVTYENAGPVPDHSSERIPTSGEMARLITTRRSIRDYRRDLVPKKTFEQIFDIIRYAPTGMNGQSVEWLVIYDPDEVAALVAKVIEWAREIISSHPEDVLAPVLPLFVSAYEHGLDKICHSAPHVVIAHSQTENPIGFVDAMIAMTHLDLIAPTFGLGTCWAGIVQGALRSSPEIRKSIGIPDGHVPHYAMMVGYPKYRYRRAPKRNAVKITWK